MLPTCEDFYNRGLLILLSLAWVGELGVFEELDGAMLGRMVSPFLCHGYISRSVVDLSKRVIYYIYHDISWRITARFRSHILSHNQYILSFTRVLILVYLVVVQFLLFCLLDFVIELSEILLLLFVLKTTPILLDSTICPSPCPQLAWAVCSQMIPLICSPDAASAGCSCSLLGRFSILVFALIVHASAW